MLADTRVRSYRFKTCKTFGKIKFNFSSNCHGALIINIPQACIFVSSGLLPMSKVV
jgi:hypothetical protein